MDQVKQRLSLSTGVELDVWTAGNSTQPPILFLHGFPESHRTWRHQIAALSNRFFCVAPDQRGYARSSKPPAVSDYEVPKLVADVFALADALGIDRFTLAAHDWGGAIGWAAALSRPERVERLIICNAPHPYVMQRTLRDSREQRQASAYVNVFRGPELEQRIAKSGLDWFFDHSFMRHLTGEQVGADDRAAYLDEWAQPGALTAMFNWYRASPMAVPPVDGPIPPMPFLDKPFPKLAMPVLVVWGMRDPALLPCQLEGLDEHVIDLTLVRVDAGHFAPWENAGAVMAAIERWLG